MIKLGKVKINTFLPMTGRNREELESNREKNVSHDEKQLEYGLQIKIKS